MEQGARDHLAWGRRSAVNLFSEAVGGRLPCQAGPRRSASAFSGAAGVRRSGYPVGSTVGVRPIQRGGWWPFAPSGGAKAFGFCPFWRGGGQGWTCRSGGQPLPCLARRSAAREVGPSRRSVGRQDEQRGFRRAGVRRFRRPWFRLWHFGPCCSRGVPSRQTGSCCAKGRVRRGPSTSPSLPAACRVGSRSAGRVSGRLDADPRCRPAARDQSWHRAAPMQAATGRAGSDVTRCITADTNRRVCPIDRESPTREQIVTSAR